MTQVLDITSEITRTNWDLPPRMINLANNPKNGLYLMVFENTFSLPIHDRHGVPSGKCVVQANRMSVKSGKFEGGLKSRVRGYHKDMHYLGDHENIKHKNVFESVLKKFYLLPISVNGKTERDLMGSHIFENFWNSSISSFLDARGMLANDQNFRTEYRNLSVDSNLDFVAMEEFVIKTGNVINQMKDVIRSQYG